MIADTCQSCGKSIEQKRYGRRRKYCEEACRRKAERSTPYRIKCAYRDCKGKVVRGKRGRPPLYCSERCKRMAYYYPGID